MKYLLFDQNKFKLHVDILPTSALKFNNSQRENKMLVHTLM